jgi:hypothetical protein
LHINCLLKKKSTEKKWNFLFQNCWKLSHLLTIRLRFSVFVFLNIAKFG